MEIVIKIPDKMYEDAKSGKDIGESWYITQTIKNGIPYESKGEWIGNAFDEHHCNRCGHPALWEEEPDDYYEVQSRFCPNCGAKMKGGAE